MQGSNSRQRMELSIAQIARMSRLLDEALLLDAAQRAAWLETLPEEQQDLALALREALLPGEDELHRLEKLDNPPPLTPAPATAGFPLGRRGRDGRRVAGATGRWGFPARRGAQTPDLESAAR